MGINYAMVITRDTNSLLSLKALLLKQAGSYCYEYLRDFVSNVIVWWGGKSYGKTCFCILWGCFSLTLGSESTFDVNFVTPDGWKPWKLDLWIIILHWKWFLPPPDALTCWTFCTYHLMWQGPSYLRWWFGHVYRRSRAGQPMWDESKGL